MTILIGDIKDVGLEPTSGVVTVRSKVLRRARETTGVITPELKTYPLENGRFRTHDLDPGRIVVDIDGQSFHKTIEFDLPSQVEPVTLSDVLTRVEEYAPEVVTSARAAASKAETSAIKAAGSEARAENSAKNAEESRKAINAVVDGAVGVVRAEFQELHDGAITARDNAKGSEELVKDCTARAENSATRAEGAADNAASRTAELVRSELAGFAQSASLSEQSAKSSATVAASSATQTGRDKDAVMKTAGIVESDRVRAETAAQQAGESKTVAVESAAAASSDASAAASAKSGAEVARDEALQAAASAKVGAPDGGWGRDSLNQDVVDSLTRADSALLNVPKANKMLAGGVRLTGDLAGTWDDVKVPGLADKMDKLPVSESVIAGSLAKRDGEGYLQAKTPEWFTLQNLERVATVKNLQEIFETISNGQKNILYVDGDPEKESVMQVAMAARDAIVALTARVAELERTVVTSTTYRKIERGTGYDTSTIYIQE